MDRVLSGWAFVFLSFTVALSTFWKTPLANALGPLPADESGVDESVTSKFPGSTVVTGSAASGAGDNRDIPVEEGGEINKLGR